MKKGYIKIALFLFMLIALPNSIKAVTFSVTKSADNLRPGDSVQIIVNASDVNDTDSLYGYNLTLEFDSSKLEVTGDAGSASNISANGNRVSISNKTEEQRNSDFEVAKFNMRVTSASGGDTTNLSLSGTCNINGEAGSCNYNGSSISIASLGTDASLSSLSIPNTTISPEFSSDVTEYRATVQDITEIKVEASASDPNASISITDNYKSLQKGDNKIDVVVTSEDGNNTKTYTLIVTLNKTPTQEELNKADTTLKSLTIKNQKIEFKSSQKTYSLTVPYSISSLEVTAVPTNEKAKVTIEGNKKLTAGKKNTILITVKSEDGTKEDTYQIIVTREEEEKEIEKTCPDYKNLGDWNAFMWIVVTVIALVTFTLGIVLGYFLCKKDILKKIFKKKEKVETPVEIETLSDTIDLSETVKQVEKENDLNTKLPKKKV